VSFGGLSLLGSALDVFQQAENVVSNNISNVNTPGASEEKPILEESAPLSTLSSQTNTLSPGGVGAGVTLASIQRVHDNALDALYRVAYSSQNYYTVQQQNFTNLQTAWNEPSGGISTAYSQFQTSVNQLASVNAQGANATSGRQGVYQAAQTLVQSLNTAGNAVTSQEQNVQTQATNIVNSVNTLLDHIAQLNGEIREGTAAGENTAGYLDQRDTAIDQLSQYVPTTTVVENNGSTLITINGQAIVNDTQTYHLAQPVVTEGSSGTPQLVVGMANDPQPSNPTALQLGSGQLGGLVDLYNTGLATYGSQLDGFANALATQMNRVNMSGYDGTGAQGTALFSGTNTAGIITAGSIALNITSPNQIAIASASTSAGSLTQAINSSTTPITTSTDFQGAGNAVFANPPPGGGLQGTLTVAVDGLSQTYTYNTATTDGSIGSFVAKFNAAQLGVSAAFDPTSQTIQFTRDPSNESLAMQAQSGYAPTADFTITDSNGATATQSSAGSPATGLLDLLGAGAINHVAQTSSNAFGAQDSQNAVQLQNLFTQNIAVPPVTNSLAAGVSTGTHAVALSGSLGQIAVGQTLTIDAGTASQENVLVTAVNATASPPTFTAKFQNAHLLGASVQATPQQTLGQYYGTILSSIGFAAQNASTGVTTQTNLSSGIDAKRQASSGINLDQETQNLLQYQMAYQAVAKTFSTIETMLNTVISQMI